MGSPLDDLAVLAARRPLRRFDGREELLDSGDARRHVHVVTEGRARLFAETPFGAHLVGEVPPPFVFDLRHAVGGGEGVCRAVPDAGASAFVLPSGEARELLFDAGAAGGAFRRILLASLTTSLREAIASLSRFFDAPPGSAVPEGRRASAPAEERPVDPEHAGALFDAAGLDPAILPALGLVARTLLPGATLAAAGTPGEEAFLVAEGRLRVSVEIPGAGEEALAILRPGEIAGEMSLVDDAPRSADLHAHNGPAMVYVLSREVFRRLMETGDPQGAPLLAGLAVILARRLEEAIRKTAGFRILSGPI
jgi:CRP-like cAMP-binding protein